MDDMNELGSCELKSLDVMTSSGLWVVILHHDLRIVDGMNDSRL